MWENPDHCQWWHPWACGPPWPLSVPAPTFMLSFPSTMNYNLQTKTLYSPKFFLVWCLSEQQESKQKLGQACVPCENAVLLGHLFTSFPCITGHSGLLHSGIFTTLWVGLPLLSRKALVCLKFTVMLCLALNCPSNINRLLIHTQPYFSAFRTK